MKNLDNADLVCSHHTSLNENKDMDKENTVTQQADISNNKWYFQKLHRPSIPLVLESRIESVHSN